jgi:spore coat polysaccharide biosynthesis protein SpsF
MRTVGIIQARTGSSRLPGKIMYPLAGRPVLEHVVGRASAAETVDDITVATTDRRRDDVTARVSDEMGTDVYRGDEDDVLRRMFEAATATDADSIVRITGDCPLLSPRAVDAVVKKLHQTEADYATNIITRTFPRGLDVEAFSMESFERVERESEKPIEREHVTPYFRAEHVDFHRENVAANEVFQESNLLDRTDLRLTLDEDSDYVLLSRVFDGVDFKSVLPLERAVEYIDVNNLADMNADVVQRSE